MGKLLDASYYDHVYAISIGYAMSEREAPWAPLWSEVAQRVPKAHKILDIGCGPGHMAALLKDNPVYTGIDFSAEAVRQAGHRAGNRTFICADAFELPWPVADTYLLLEVLEHVVDDTGLLSRVPSRARIILSVPNFDSEGHVRIFKDTAHVASRYGRLFSEYKMDALALHDGDKTWFIMDGTRK